MRDNTKAFCRTVAESLDCPGPVHEFGSYQTHGQVQYADLRGLFPGRAYVGSDLRAGPGVDRVIGIARRADTPDASLGNEAASGYAPAGTSDGTPDFVVIDLPRLLGRALALTPSSTRSQPRP